MTRQEIIEVAEGALAFIEEQVGRKPVLINAVLDMAKQIDATEEAIYIAQNAPETPK